MKLLFDENISHRILKKLNDVYMDSMHCKNIHPIPKNDLDIWNHAKENDYIIVTFDEDFYEIMLLKGFPPKIIWLRMGNTSTDSIAETINNKFYDINNLFNNKEVGIIELH